MFIAKFVLNFHYSLRCMLWAYKRNLVLQFGQKAKRYSKKVEPYAANAKMAEELSSLAQPETNADHVSESGSKKSFNLSI